MLAVGMGALPIMLDKGQEEDWFGSHFITALAVTAAVMRTALVRWKLYVPQPIVHFRLLADRAFAAGIVLVTVLAFAVYGRLVLLPLFMQTLPGMDGRAGRHLDQPARPRDRPVHAAGGLPAGLGRPVDAGLRLRRRQPGVLRLRGDEPPVRHRGYLLAPDQPGVGMAFIFVRLTTLTMDPIPMAEMGYAASLYSLMRNIGSSMAISFVARWVARRSQFHQSVPAAHVTPGGEEARQTIEQLRTLSFRSGSDWATAGRRALAAFLRRRGRTEEGMALGKGRRLPYNTPDETGGASETRTFLRQGLRRPWEKSERSRVRSASERLRRPSGSFSARTAG